MRKREGRGRRELGNEGKDDLLPKGVDLYDERVRNQKGVAEFKTLKYYLYLY